MPPPEQDEIIKILNQIDPKKMPNMLTVLRMCVDIIAPILTYIANLPRFACVTPVTPVLKGERKSDF